MISPSIAIGITISLAIVSGSVGLLIVGYRCYHGYSPLSDNNKGCQDIYISGIIMTFIIGCLLVFYLLFRIADYMDSSVVSNVQNNPVVSKVKNNPVRRKSSIVTTV